MKKLIIICSLLVSGWLLTNNAQAQAEYPEYIDSYQVDFVINKDSTIDITETIKYNFNNLERRGIYRYLPFIYSNESRAKIRLDFYDFQVVDEQGNDYNFTASQEPQSWFLKIGDADKYVTGAQTYIIKYKVNNGLRYNKDYDELYWDSVGTEWKVPILYSSARVSLPQQVSKNDLQLACYYGSFGSSTKCSESVLSDGSIFFEYNQVLKPAQGMTIVLGWPKGITAEPSWWQKLSGLLRYYGILVIPILVFILLFFIWRKTGRDPKGRGTIITQFQAPDNLSPAEVGVIIDEKAHDKDISAELIYLAVQGFIKIKKIKVKKLLFTKDDYKIIRTSDNYPEPVWQKNLLKAIMKRKKEVILSEVSKVGVNLNIIKDEVYKNLVADDYLLKNPQKTRLGYRIIAAIVGIFLIVPWVFLGIILNFSIIASVISGLATGLIIFIFSFFMPSRTKKGVLAKEQILGLKSYLTVAEKDRMAFHEAPDKSPKHFSELLPYAIALGVEKEWAKQFKDLYLKVDWYSDVNNKAFTAMVLSSNLNVFSNTAIAGFSSGKNSGNSNFRSGRSGFSRGGGFSGGGSGGGGGGSW